MFIQSANVECWACDTLKYWLQLYMLSSSNNSAHVHRSVADNEGHTVVNANWIRDCPLSISRYSRTLRSIINHLCSTNLASPAPRSVENSWIFRRQTKLTQPRKFRIVDQEPRHRSIKFSTLHRRQTELHNGGTFPRQTSQPRNVGHRMSNAEPDCSVLAGCCAWC